MPRVTYSTYCKRRQLLVQEHVQREARAFVFLSPNEQWDLYGYFVPHRELSEVELRECWQQVAEEDLSLPQRAGRAFKKIEPMLRRAMTYAEAAKLQHQAGSVHIYPLVQPEIDARKIARALIAWAKWQTVQKVSSRGTRK